MSRSPKVSLPTIILLNKTRLSIEDRRDLPLTKSGFDWQGWFGHFKPRARPTRELKTGGMARNFPQPMAQTMACLGQTELCQARERR